MNEDDIEMVDSSTRPVASGESVGRTNSDPDVVEAVRMNRLDLAISEGEWRKHMARRVGEITVVRLSDPDVYIESIRTSSIKVGMGRNGHGKKAGSKAFGAVRGT